MWIPSRGVNGEYGYLNTKTGEFRTTLPNSKEEKLKEQLKLRKAALVTHSARQAKYERTDAKRRNHSDETVKKQISVPIITMNPDGTFTNNYILLMAPNESSLSTHDPIAEFYIGTKALNPVFNLLGKGYTYGMARIGDNYARAKIISNELNKSLLNLNSPVIPLNIGWGPKQTFKVSHASNDGNMLTFFPKRWDVVNEGANPHGIWFQGKLGTPRTDITNPGKGIKAAKARALFANRPVLMQGNLTLEKPMITVGDVPNRSWLSYYADKAGADGLIYNGVYDNGYNNNLVILSFKKLAPNVTSEIGSNSFTLADRTSLKFFERPTSKLTDLERAGVPKVDRNLPLNTHLKGDKAVLMFKEYGGMKIPEGSINGELLRKYVLEARIRYGLMNNKNITDEEIAQSLYKHVLELGKGSAAKNILGEPLLLFRGDTKRYTELKPRPTPEELEKMGGTMDNSLGNLFLGLMPESMGGLERYIVHVRDFGGDKRIIGSGTGSKAVLPDGNAVKEFTNDVIGTIPEGSYLLYSYPYKYGNISAYKLPASWSESGVNDINAFVVRTPNMRNASKEISVLNDDFIILGGSKVNYYGPIRRKVLDKDGFPQIVDETGKVVGNGLAGSSDRSAMAKHYRQVLDKAKNKQLGLLKSDKNSLLRDEHDNYDYFALPNFNIRGAKHLLSWDLRKPIDWNSSNIFKKNGGKLVKQISK